MAPVRIWPIFAACLAASALSAPTARAFGDAPEPPSAPEAICDWSAAFAAEREGAPLAYLRALTRTETGRPSGGALRPWPWTVNMEGEGRWFDTREAALAYVVREMRRGARSFDVGCFQINYHWHGENFASVEAMFDPAANAIYAARFLSALKREGGGWRWAVGRYHSRTPALAAKYGARFDRILASLPDASPSEAYGPDARRAASTKSKTIGVSVAFPRFERRGASAAAPAVFAGRATNPHSSASGDDREAPAGGVVMRLSPAATPLFERP